MSAESYDELDKELYVETDVAADDADEIRILSASSAFTQLLTSDSLVHSELPEKECEF